MTALWLSMAWAWLPYRRSAPTPIWAIIETLLTIFGLIIVLRYLRSPFLGLLEDTQPVNSAAAVGLLIVFWLFGRAR